MSSGFPTLKPLLIAILFKVSVNLRTSLQKYSIGGSRTSAIGRKAFGGQ